MQNTECRVKESFVGDDILGIPWWLWKTAKQSYCMSFWAKKTAKRFSKSKFCWGSEPQATIRYKTEEQRDEGIWRRVWVACFCKCNIYNKKPPRFVTISRFGKNASRFRSVISLRESSTSRYALRSEWQVDCLFSDYRATNAGDSWIAPTENNKIHCRGDSRIARFSCNFNYFMI